MQALKLTPVGKLKLTGWRRKACIFINLLLQITNTSCLHSWIVSTEKVFLNTNLHEYKAEFSRIPACRQTKIRGNSLKIRVHSCFALAYRPVYPSGAAGIPPLVLITKAGALAACSCIRSIPATWPAGTGKHCLLGIKLDTGNLRIKLWFYCHRIYSFLLCTFW